ncbi:hypothetical protein GPL06_13235 [Bacteroides salyersiae]|uniref:hypothetical protein n=1 Tax=Bacteroides salyersiae TaxID=291644 RepID=UPI001B8D1129|nr:hypothetical protein [Bacteroides salyersiae]MBT9873758.1 hypothetical protein [Bacteroides salyersiae]QUT74916.1 hypothetical protein INE81_01359 [Bacteroides salyersiae]
MQANVEAVDKLSKSAIEIAQAAGDLGALKVMFGFAVTFTALLLIVFVAQIVSNQKMLRAIKETSDKTGRYFSDLNNRTVGKEEAKAITKETLDRSCALVKYYILKIRMENHLVNKEATFNKIRLMIDNDFNGQRAFLGKFLYKEKQLSFVATLEDNQAISNLMTEQVYLPTDNFTVSLMSQAVGVYFDGLKLRLLGKIDEL